MGHLPNYDLNDNNCADFVREALGAAGIQVDDVTRPETEMQSAEREAQRRREEQERQRREQEEQKKREQQQRTN